MKKLNTKTATATVSKARRADTYRGARRNLARAIRREASARGRALTWPTAWMVAQSAAYRAEKAASAARKAKSVKVFESIGELVAGVDISTPAQAAPVPAEPAAPAQKKPRAKKAATPQPETVAPKAPRKAAAKAPKAADAKPKAAPRKRVVKPAA